MTESTPKRGLQQMFDWFVRKWPSLFGTFIGPALELLSRLSRYLHLKYNRALQLILIPKTPAVSCVLHGRPEIHSLVCHRDAYNYILAIKSLLRFYNDVTVVVHDDGSLTKKDKRTIKKHIKNINIIDRGYADAKINRILDHYPNCRRYRDAFVNALQLFDYMLLCESEKIVSLDSDILFFKKPDTLIDWVRDGKEIIYFWENKPWGIEEFFAKINIDDCCVHMNIGLLCFYKEAMNLDLIEQFLSKIEIFWCTGQCIFPVLLKKQIEEYGLSFFEPSEYQYHEYFSDAQTARHYLFSAFHIEPRLSDIYLSDWKKIVKELSNAPKADTI